MLSAKVSAEENENIFMEHGSGARGFSQVSRFFEVFLMTRSRVSASVDASATTLRKESLKA